MSLQLPSNNLPDHSDLGLSLHNFSILRPVIAPPRLQSLSILLPVRNPAADLSFIFDGRLSPSDPMALDIETMGNDPSDPQSIVVGVGLADSRGSCYIDLRTSCSETWLYLLHRLAEHQIPLIAHNLYFDAAYVLRDLKAAGHPTGWLNWQHCTYALYKFLACEGWNGQRWGLKDAQLQLLGWTETNETELDLWLIRSGFISDQKKEEKANYYWIQEIERWCSPIKAEMWRAPTAILGHYCCLDADSTYQLYQQVLLPALERFDALKAYAAPELYGEFIRLMIESRLGGILVDKPALENHAAHLRQMAALSREGIIKHPAVAPALAEYNRRIVAELYEAEPEKFLKLKQRPPEPAKLTGKGNLSKNWLRWQEQGPRYEVPVVSKNWRRWWAKLLLAMDTQHFNFNSDKQVGWLLYEWLKFPVTKKTESGQPSIDEDALKSCGEPGALLIEYNTLQKELSYVESCLEQLRPDGTSTAIPANPSNRAGSVHDCTDGSSVPDPTYLHAAFRVPATTTGRCAGSGSFSMHQQPKVRAYLACFKARPGKVLLEFDFDALEQIVLTELSRDRSLLKLYGPNAALNDGHLFTGASLPILGAKIRATGYDPDRPTAEAIALAKKVCKKEREISKTFNYASVYKAGPKRLMAGLALEGVHLPLATVEAMHAGYWQLYRGVLEFEEELLRQWDLNGGWILNGVGRPVGIDAGYTKDINNRAVQSTGHDLLVLFLMLFVVPSLRKAGIPFHPWLPDYHDEFIFEINEVDAERAKITVDTVALPAFNELMGGLIPLKGSATISRTLADAKGLPS